MKILSKLFATLTIALLAMSNASASYITYDSKAAFNTATTGALTDSFAGYTSFTSKTNAQASAASTAGIGYASTGFSNLNIYTSGIMCWGCNGSGVMNLAATKLGTIGGVYGFMTSISYVDGYSAFVNFADGSTADVALTSNSIFALTSNQLISSVSFGLARGVPTYYGSISFRDVTVANAVPEPGSLALLGLGLAGVGMIRRRKA